MDSGKVAPQLGMFVAFSLEIAAAAIVSSSDFCVDVMPGIASLPFSVEIHIGARSLHVGRKRLG